MYDVSSDNIVLPIDIKNGRILATTKKKLAIDLQILNRYVF